LLPSRVFGQAQWTLFKSSGHSDANKLRCPCCTDLSAMHVGKGHKHVFNAIDILPQETLSEIAARHSDILLLNWSSLRHDSLLKHFSGGSDVAHACCLAARRHLDSLVRFGQ